MLAGKFLIIIHSDTSQTNIVFSFYRVKRDMYGFVVRPEHVETYKAFAKIYEVFFLGLLFVAI